MIYRIFKFLHKPIVEEFSYILFFMLMMGAWDTIRLIFLKFSGICISLDTSMSYFCLFGRVGIWFIYAMVGACLIHFLHSKLLKYFLYLIVLTFFGIQHFLMQNFFFPISPTVFVLLSETTPRESNEFINQYIFSDAIIPTIKMVAIYALCIILMESVWHCVRKSLFLPQFLRVLISLFTVVILGVGLFYGKIFYDITQQTSADEEIFNMMPKDPFTSTYSSLVAVNIMKNNMRMAVENSRNASRPSLVNTMEKDSLNIVLVIGESYIKWHAQLYGYPLPTTPHLVSEQRNGRLFVFEDVVSTSNRTSVVMRDLLCCNNVSDGESWYTKPYLPSIFKSSGYRVDFWDNQHEFDPTAKASFTLNSFLYDPEIRKIAYDEINTSVYDYDGEFVADFASGLEKRNALHHFIIFHLMGQHHSASNRYPHDSFSYFTADSIKRNAPYLNRVKKEYIAHYDNATRYNDSVLYHIIKLFYNSNTVLVYLSDHGEEVYDYRDQCSRDYGEMTKNKLKYQFTIPFMVWCSDQFKTKYPNVISSLQEGLSRPLMIDNVCHTLFNLAGIKTEYYKSTLDILSPDYISPRRMIEGKYDYESYIN